MIRKHSRRNFMVYVLDNKKLLVCNQQEILQNTKTFAQHYWETATHRHWAGAAIEEQFPRSLRIWEEEQAQAEASV